MARQAGTGRGRAAGNGKSGNGATIVKRVLRRYGYPPDKQEQVTRTVLEQAELLCNEWTG